MSRHGDPVAVLPVAHLNEWFRDALRAAMERQRLRVDDHTEHYVVNLLALFARADALHAGAPGRARTPLAVLLADAMEAPTPEARRRGLQRLGDVSLFVAGCCSGSLDRSPVGLDYHVALGGSAYGALAESSGPGPWRTLAVVFGELAAKFLPLVDALNEVTESAARRGPREVLRLYEAWLRTGSQRALGLLQELGVHPIRSAGALRQH